MTRNRCEARRLSQGCCAKAQSAKFSEEIGNEDFNAINVATGRNSDGTGSSATDHFGFSAELNPKHFPAGDNQQFAAEQHGAGREFGPEHVRAAAAAA
jgi:hypothetical protein